MKFMITDKCGKVDINLSLSLKFSKEELIAALALVAHDVAFCNYDHFEGGDGHVQLLLMCSDTFMYSCADCEEIPISEAPHILKLYTDHGDIAVIDYIAKKRDETPIGKCAVELAVFRSKHKY
jgi:hypothetical protein